jgi:HD-GYP domain-containing protein (c-di-GMP phosphodiesterase class II)
MRIAAAEGLSVEVAAETSVREGEGIAGWVLMTGQPVLVHDQGTSPRFGNRDRRSAISAPIQDEGRILGVLNVSVPRQASAFRKRDLEALQLLGAQVAAALGHARTLRSARELYLSALRALVLALETKDPYAQGATDRVVEYATMLATELGLDKTECEALRSAALLHDIGMPPVRQLTDAATTSLSSRDRELIDLHPALAAEILHEVPALQMAIPIVYHHHEWYDGRGYIAGLAGEDIPVGARVLAVADAFVAMTSQRPYRVTMTAKQALAELEAKAGTQFDPVVVAAFVRSLGRGGDPTTSSDEPDSAA